jgi:Fe-S oxidoreductase
MQENLQNAARQLLTDKKVEVVIGYGETESGEVCPTFVCDPNDVTKLIWDDRCKMNLVTYLHLPEIKKYGKPAVVVNSAGRRAMNVLLVESQFAPGDVELIDVEPDVTEPDKSRYEKLNKLMAMSRKERLTYWQKEFSRCFKCYACRQACPLCYCQVCIVDKNKPTRLDTSASLKGNFAWNITRAFHLAGRCISCDACANACPAGIDLTLLNMTLVKSAEEQFDGFIAGKTLETLPIIGSFSTEDEESFIR